MHQVSVAQVETYAQRSIDATIVRADRRHEQRSVKYDVLIDGQAVEGDAVARHANMPCWISSRRPSESTMPGPAESLASLRSFSSAACT